MKKCIQITVTGKVQGVFYRKFAIAKALESGITGFVKNQTDGSVYIEACAADDVLSLFVDWCYTGSPDAEVANVEVTVMDMNSGFSSFTEQE